MLTFNVASLAQTGDQSRPRERSRFTRLHINRRSLCLINTRCNLTFLQCPKILSRYLGGELFWPDEYIVSSDV